MKRSAQIRLDAGQHGRLAQRGLAKAERRARFDGLRLGVVVVAHKHDREVTQRLLGLDRADQLQSGGTVGVEDAIDQDQGERFLS